MTRKLRVVHMIGAAKPGGAEMFAYRLLVAQHKRDELDVLAIVREGGWLQGVLADAGVPYKTAKFGGMFDFKTGREIRKICKDYQADVVQSWMNRATRFVPKGPWAKVARLGGFYDLKYYTKKVDYLIGNTDEIVKYVVKHGWKASHAEMIGNFVPNVSGRDEKVGLKVRGELGIPAGATVMMMAGRLHKVKGVDIALKALAQMPNDFILLLVGDGPLRSELQSLAHELGMQNRVRWAGWQDSVTKFAAASDIWLAPSRHEPLGNTVLDGWVHEVPVIASNTGGLAMLVEEGVTGLRVEVEDIDGLRDAVLKLAKDKKLQAKLVKGGSDRLKRDYSEDAIVGQYVDYYNRITGRTVKEQGTKS
ncbi:MAG: glycosyl transferase [Pseudomonas fluorescens]|nr:MAG: glycosyl transferase [Pseudomonas fluorescens]